MDSKYQVSVIVCTYNPDWNKYKKTLRKFLQQENIVFEIIVSDDGSKENYFEKVKQLFADYKFTDYKFVKNDVNVGTVKNYYGALLASEGEYTFALSPGDYVYDDYTLNNFYTFAKRKQAKICFGNSVYYLPGKEIKLLQGQFNNPVNLQLFSDNADYQLQKIGFYFANAILGVSFFKRRDVAIEYTQRILNVSKYVEDNTALAFYYADNNKLFHYDAYVSWYEYGTGVSTNKQEIWNKRLAQDFDNTYELLKGNYPDDAIVDAAIIFHERKNKYIKALELLLKHPVIFIQFLYIKYFVPKVQVNFQPVNMANFPKYED
ncbi:MAG: glycosyltransferase [Phascolarctobacterium sp.]|nr:glycosyltransferase [Candidatus Phascolarctobacterium caballi]